MKAKTYKSTNNWTSPQSLDTFGIPIPNENNPLKYLGLEEYNFIELLKNYKLAFIPAFSTKLRPFVPQLDLFYHDGNGAGTTKHYATLINVTQLVPQQINAIRQHQLAPFPGLVTNDTAFMQEYGGLFQTSLNVWSVYWNSNNIIAKGKNDRFVVNVRYEKLIHIQPYENVPWANLMFARALYP